MHNLGREFVPATINLSSLTHFPREQIVHNFLHRRFFVQRLDLIDTSQRIIQNDVFLVNSCGENRTVFCYKRFFSIHSQLITSSSVDRGGIVPSVPLRAMANAKRKREKTFKLALLG